MAWVWCRIAREGDLYFHRHTVSQTDYGDIRKPGYPVDPESASTWWNDGRAYRVSR